MNLHWNIQNIATVFLLLICLSSCKKFLAIGPPRTALITSTVFKDDETAISAQSAIYSEMANDLTYNFSSKLALSADEWKSVSTDPLTLELYQNALTATNYQISSYFWNPLYQYIYQSNKIIEGLGASDAVSTAVKNQLEGEAKFTRAFCYFYLVNLFGDVPLLTSSNYQANSLASRNTRDDIYHQIILDLIEARTLLDNNYLNGDLTSESSERTRPNKMAADALLARVYLYRNKFDSAYRMSTEVIRNHMYRLDNLNEVFLTTSKGAIWQLNSPYNTYEARGYILNSIPSYPYYGSFSDGFIAQFESGDMRLTNWIGTYYNDGTTYYYPYKYKNSDFFGTVTEYQVVLRLSEQYLIRAEAQANGAGHGIEGAIKDLNKIRNRASLPDYTGITDSDSIIGAVLHERRVELFTEWGHRWLDLKRTGRIDSVMKLATPRKGGGAWNPDQQLYPIPQAERAKDINLTQNDGYN